MCGIVAIVGDGHAALGHRRGEALDLLTHRGPDDRGSWADRYAWLGTRRLSIIDLSLGGHQPMVHDPSGVVVTFNGEIYNYLELRAELEAAGHIFRTRSDTEVLLAAYLNWGADCLGRLNGMWGFLIWDPRHQRAFFSRDRLGIKPFYFALVDGGLSVASEPKALLALHPALRRVDEATLYGFLAEGRLYAGNGSFYDQIEVLPAGHWGTYVPGASAPDIRAYWEPPAPIESDPDYRDAADAFGKLLTDSVRLRMRSDVAIGFTLSGGLDSSAILQAGQATQSSRTRRLRAFTSVYPTSPGARIVDERHWANQVAAKYDQVELEEVPADLGDWLSVLQRIVWHMDGPGYSPAVFPLWKIMERAREARVPVLLEGQGADELLGGYAQHAAVALWESLSSGRLPAFARDFTSYSRTFSTKALTLYLIRERASFATRAYRRRVGALGTLEPNFVRQFKTESTTKPATTVNDRLEADLTRDILPGLLHYGDAISMAHSIESRLPFLDYRVVEFVSAMPAGFKVGNGETKRILRDHLRSVGLQVIADRPDKLGYPTPTYSWLADNRGAVLNSLLVAPGAEIHTYCRPKQIERLIDYHVSGRSGAGNHLYRLLTTELWLRTCIAQRTTGTT